MFQSPPTRYIIHIIINEWLWNILMLNAIRNWSSDCVFLYHCHIVPPHSKMDIYIESRKRNLEKLYINCWTLISSDFGKETSCWTQRKHQQFRPLLLRRRHVRSTSSGGLPPRKWPLENYSNWAMNIYWLSIYIFLFIRLRRLHRLLWLIHPQIPKSWVYIYIYIFIYIWANYNISPTWIVGPFGDDFPY